MICQKPRLVYTQQTHARNTQNSSQYSKHKIIPARPKLFIYRRRHLDVKFGRVLHKNCLACALCLVPCALCLVPCALCLVPCALCLVPCALCLVPCALCLVPCAVCRVPLAAGRTVQRLTTGGTGQGRVPLQEPFQAEPRQGIKQLVPQIDICVFQIRFSWLWRHHMADGDSKNLGSPPILGGPSMRVTSWMTRRLASLRESLFLPPFVCVLNFFTFAIRALGRPHTGVCGLCGGSGCVVCMMCAVCVLCV